jgi:hypothetical protein
MPGANAEGLSRAVSEDFGSKQRAAKGASPSSPSFFRVRLWGGQALVLGMARRLSWTRPRSFGSRDHEACEGHGGAVFDIRLTAIFLST